ncbi:hypothetical protein C8R46DRAFT_1343544 [Mycena filopes]|nr:hypothetical protein C8R46DRAFT_1343544 [Mycena filopes]
MSNPPGILALSSDLTPEVVDFWGFKYKEVKQELEALKVSLAFPPPSHSHNIMMQSSIPQENDVPTYGELKRQVEQLQGEAIASTRRLQVKEKFIQDMVVSTRNEQRATQQKLEGWMAEKGDLLAQLGRLNAERVSWHRQIQVCYSQAASLAVEADRQRMLAVAELFNPENFLDESFTPVGAAFGSMDFRKIGGCLQREGSGEAWQLYFMPRPPNSIPLRVQGVAQPGYWFYPFNLSPMDAPFELIVEIDCNKWLYFGRYTSRPFPNYEMRLSEWMALDEQTKLIFCARVAGQNSKPATQFTSYATTQIDVRERYDSGQWSVPCFSLQCVGYDMELYEALHSTASLLRGEPDISSSSSSSRAQSLGKRRRTETPSICALEEDVDTKKKFARIDGTVRGELNHNGGE